jgi:hypothetical protein
VRPLELKQISANEIRFEEPDVQDVFKFLCKANKHSNERQGSHVVILEIANRGH